VLLSNLLMVHTIVALSVLYRQQLAPQKPTAQAKRTVFLPSHHLHMQVWRMCVLHTSIRSTVLRQYCAHDPHLIASAVLEVSHHAHACLVMMLDAGVIVLSFHVKYYYTLWSLLLFIDLIQSHNCCSNTKTPPDLLSLA